MKRNSSPVIPSSGRSSRYALPRLDPIQLFIEHQAMRLRARLGLSDMDALDQTRALACIPDCNIASFRSLKTMPFEHLNHFRTEGIGCGALAVRAPDGSHGILFNDAHPPNELRVYIMEEVFHLLLNHPLDVVRPYAQDGIYRTYRKSKEDEAYGCGVAALVPYWGLQASLASGEHIARIAERFVVPVPVVEFRIAATRLGDLANATIRQLALSLSLVLANERT